MWKDYFTSEGDDSDLAKGLLAGVAGGLLASLVMEQFQSLWSIAAQKIEEARRDDDAPAKKSKSRAQPATVKVADAISQKILGQKIPRSKKKLAGEAVHYAMGATSAAIYGAVVETLPAATAGDGLAFGTVVWLLADEVSVPAFGLSKSPRKIPLRIHAYALLSHLVYGWTTEMVRRTVRKAL